MISILITMLAGDLDVSKVVLASVEVQYEGALWDLQ